MNNSVDPDQLTSSETSRSGILLFSKNGLKFVKNGHSALRKTYMVYILVCIMNDDLFVGLILYVPVNIFLSCQEGSSWVVPILSRE